MKRTLFASAAILALLASAIFAFADIARPKPSPAEPKSLFYTGMTITSDSKAYEARLQISENTLKRLQEAAGRNGETTSLSQRIMHSSGRTMMAGVFMFSTSTIIFRTGILPRWVAFVGFACAVVLILIITNWPWIALIFPLWMLVISTRILLAEFR